MHCTRNYERALNAKESPLNANECPMVWYVFYDLNLLCPLHITSVLVCTGRHSIVVKAKGFFREGRQSNDQ